MQTRWALVLLGFCVSGVALITQNLYSFDGYHVADYPDKASIKANSVASCAKHCSRFSNCELFGYNKEKKVCQISMPKCLLSIPKTGQSSVVFKCFRKKHVPFAMPTKETATPQNDHDPSTIPPPEVKHRLITRNTTFVNGTSIVRNLAEDDIFNHTDLVGETFQFTSDHQEQTFVIEFESRSISNVSITFDFSYCIKGTIKVNEKCHAFIRRPSMDYNEARLICTLVGGKVSRVDLVRQMDPQIISSFVNDTLTYVWTKDANVEKCEKLFLDGTGNSSIIYNESCEDQIEYVSCRIKFTDIGADKLKVEDRCYYGYNLNRTWEDGNALCHHLGYQMAKPIYDSSASDGLKNPEIFQGRKTFNSGAMTSAWIGLRRDGSSWFTFDGQLFLFDNFEDFIHPDNISIQEGCTYFMPGTDIFFLDSCDVERPVLCFFECAHPFKVTTEIEPIKEIPFYTQTLGIDFPQIPYSGANRQFVKFKISRISAGRYGDFTVKSILVY